MFSLFCVLGGRMNMCRALEELEKEGIKKGIKKE